MVEVLKITLICENKNLVENFSHVVELVLVSSIITSHNVQWSSMCGHDKNLHIVLFLLQCVSIFSLCCGRFTSVAYSLFIKYCISLKTVVAFHFLYGSSIRKYSFIFLLFLIERDNSLMFMICLAGTLFLITSPFESNFIICGCGFSIFDHGFM